MLSLKYFGIGGVYLPKGKIEPLDEDLFILSEPQEHFYRWESEAGSELLIKDHTGAEWQEL